MARSTWRTGTVGGVVGVLGGAVMLLWIAGLPGAPRADMASRGTAAPITWTTHLEEVKRALARQDPTAARQAWQHAHGAALASRGWEGMLEVGNASLRMGDLSSSHEASLAMARRLYLGAFFRARAEGSLEGVLRAAEAFAALGDGEVVAQCLRVAERMAIGVQDARTASRLLALRDRQAHQVPDVKRLTQGLP